MSDLSLIDVVNLIRSEIARTEIGDVKRIIGPAGERGPQGEAGIQGPQGPRGNDGKQGPAGVKGDQGKKGDKGVKGDDGADGVGIARVEQDIDNAIVVYLTDGNQYTIEMPLINDDGSLAKEVHFKTGSGGSGQVDLSMYVRRPGTDLRDGRWLAYRETENGANKEWSPITTDMVETNGQLMFRDSLGRFQPTPEELDELTNQLKVNRFIWDAIQQIDAKAGGVAISEDPPVEPENGMFWFDNSEDVMQLYIWHKDSDAWVPVAPPTTLEGRVAAGETTQAAIIAQIQESLEDQADLADRIAAGETEQSTLKNKVNALEGVIGEYSLVFTMDNSNPRAGEFNLKDGAMQVTNTLASADYITLSDTDRNGNAINLDRITEGDVLRFSSVDGQAAEIKITDGTNGFFAFTKVSGELDRLSDMPYQFILLSSFDPAGLATVDYVDAQDATKMSKSGEQMLTEGAWRIKQPKSGGGNSTFININDNEMHLYHVAYPESPTHAANMQYVDDQIAAIPEPNLSGYATEQYVDDKVAAIPAPSASSPAPLLWKYNPNVMANELGNGEFNLSASPTHGGAGEWHIYFSNRDARGQMWFPSDGGSSYSHEVGDQLASIRDRDAICCHGKTQKWYFNEGTNNYVKLKLTYYRKQFSMSNGKYYLITVPGYMPFFPYSANAYSNGTHS